MAREKDAKKRFMVTVTRSVPVDEQLKSLIPQEVARRAEFSFLASERESRVV
jgi:hypothetical protein